ncbi:Plasmodium RESA N-terminal, putative [Plasmodium vivax]|uniref:Plasmodium RESA N-terminal, putative n=1 Tax=Plasmodium vivax TaxID=5855 RepID=A0A1G4H9A2_PLAVI|nr:Plasmodium RESA N-terminal, putative [Plasmodium vivax]
MKENLIYEKFSNGRVSNRDMVSLFDAFNKLYVTEKAIMMKRLSNTLNDLSTKYKIPAKETGELLRECKQSIESEHNAKIDSYKKRHDSFVSSSNAKASSFMGFYKKYVVTLHNALKRSEKKWYKIFAERANRYGAAAPKQ